MEMLLLLTPADCTLTEDRIPEPPPLLTQEILSPWADAAHPPTPTYRMRARGMHRILHSNVIGCTELYPTIGQR